MILADLFNFFIFLIKNITIIKIQSEKVSFLLGNKVSRAPFIFYLSAITNINLIEIVQRTHRLATPTVCQTR